MSNTYGDRSSRPDVVEEVRTRLSEAWEVERDNRNEAARDMEFLAGKQWPSDEVANRDEAKRPYLTINRLPQFVRQVTNDIRQADVSIKVAPSDGSVIQAEQVVDPGAEGEEPGPPKKPVSMAKVYDGLIREIQYRSTAGLAYATAAEHQVSCGIGHIRIVTDYVSDELFDQDISIEAIPNPLGVYWDPGAVKQDRSDASWCVVTEVMAETAFKAKYPGAAVTTVDIDEDNTGGFYWYNSDEVRVAEYWVKRAIKKTIAELQDGRIVELERGMQIPSEMVARTRVVETYKVEQYLVSGAEILEGPNEWPSKYIPIIPVIGSEIPLEGKTLRHGLIRYARDPQMLYNYARTSAAESMAQAPKAPYIVTSKMVSRWRQYWDVAHKKLLPYLPYDPDPEAPGAAPQRLPGADIPTAYVQEAGIADGDIKATVGIYDPQLGQRSNESSGKAILAREQQGDTGTFHYSDNLKFALEMLGRQLIDLIPRIYDNQRVIRVLGEDDSELYVPINQAVGRDADGQPVYINDLSVGRYDCRVKIGPSYATKRMESADSMMQFVQAVPDAAGAVMDLVAKNMDWPGAEAIAERLRNMVPPEVLGEDAAPVEPDPMAEQQQQMQMAMAELEMAEKQAGIERLQIENQKMMVEMQKIQAEIAEKLAKTDKTEAETDLLEYDRAEDAERYDIDREDRFEQAEQSRQDRLREFSMRNQVNGASGGNAESNNGAFEQ